MKSAEICALLIAWTWVAEKESAWVVDRALMSAVLTPFSAAALIEETFPPDAPAKAAKLLDDSPPMPVAVSPAT